MFGVLACILVTCAYLPACFQAWKDKKCGMNYTTLVVLLLGMLFWSFHALENSDWPLLASSMISFMQLMFLSLYKIKQI